MGKCLSDRLQKLQNRASRLITYSDYNTRSTDILHALGWDTLEQRCAKQLAVSVYKARNNLYIIPSFIIPEGLESVFESTSNVHSYDLRGSCKNIFIPRPRTEAAKRSFSYHGALHFTR